MSHVLQPDPMTFAAKGTSARQAKVARRLTITAAVVAIVCMGYLLVDHAVAVYQAPADKARIEELEAAVKTDAGRAEELHKERERQTSVSLARKTSGRAIAWILLLAGGGFVAGGKWSMSFQPQRLPPLEALVALRFPPAAPAAGKKPGAPLPPGRSEEEGIDLGFVDELVARFGGSREAAIPILQAIQNHYRYLPDEALERVCELTEVTPAQIAGTSSFYAQFRRSPVGRYVVRVCHGTACHVAGAEQITRELRRHLEIPAEADTDSRRLFTIDKVACLGCCSLAPVMMIDEETAGHLTPAGARQTLDSLVPRS
jgi:NADH:ubiquinone oxidoreductase subunit E